MNYYGAKLNDEGQVAGTYYDGTGSHGFLYSDGSYATFDGPYPVPQGAYSSTSITQLNDAGQVTGSFYNSSFSGPFLYQDGTTSDISVPGASYSSVNGINDLGQLIGSFSDGRTPTASLPIPRRRT